MGDGGMLRLVDAWANEEVFQLVSQLMDEAFPADERTPVDLLERRARAGDTSFKAIYDGGAFCGFVMWANVVSITYLGYLAISPHVRSQGYGSKILRLMKEKFPDNRLVLESESVSVAADNIDQRKSRLAFYERNGFSQTGFRMRDNGVVYDVLCCNGEITRDECETVLHLVEKVYDSSAELFQGTTW